MSLGDGIGKKSAPGLDYANRYAGNPQAVEVF